MKVFVSKEFENLKNELLNLGYEVVDENSSQCCDAIICNLKSGGLKQYNMTQNIRPEGTLIIDLGNKSLDDLEYILNNRVYSSLL